VRFHLFPLYFQEKVRSSPDGEEEYDVHFSGGIGERGE
jgi:hypothetical protein